MEWSGLGQRAMGSGMVDMAMGNGGTLEYQVTWERAVPTAIEHWGVMTEHLPRYLYASHYVSGRRVLDDGTGTGYGAAIMAQSGATRVVGIDLAADAIRFASSQYTHENLHFFRMDPCMLGYPGASFDVVTSFEVLEHVTEPDRYLAEAARVLKSGGLLILSTPNRESWRPSFLELPLNSSPYHLREYSLDELRSLLIPHFRHFVVLGQSMVPPRAMELEPRFEGEQLEIQRIGRLVFAGRFAQSQSPQVAEIGWFSGDNDPEYAAHHLVVCSNEPLDGRLCSPAGLPTLEVVSDAILHAYNLYRWSPQHTVWKVEELQYLLHNALSQRQAADEEWTRRLQSLEHDALSQRQAADEEWTRRLQSLERQLAQARGDYDQSLDHIRAQDALLEERGRHIGLLQGRLTRVKAEHEMRLVGLKTGFDQVEFDLRALQRTRTVRLSRAIGLTVGQMADRFRQAVHHQGTILGALDLPSEGHAASDALQVGGWAVSSEGPIKQVQVLLGDDKSVLGLVPYGVGRLDVVRSRPWQREVDCGYAGGVSLQSVVPGPHTIIVRIVDVHGNARDFARSILVSQPDDKSPSGRDAAGQDRVRAGVERIEWCGDTLNVCGWALWPGERNPRSAQVFVNDRSVGETRVNLSTPDVQSLVPERPSASRCGFAFSCDLPAPKMAAADKPIDLTMRLVDTEGREALTAVSVFHETGLAHPVVQDLLNIVAETIAQFQCEAGRDPAILDCCTRTELATAFPEYSVFSPPTPASELPYLDNSVALVVVPAQDADLVAEAERVAAAAVIAVSQASISPESADGAPDSHPNLSVEVRWRPGRPSTRWPSVSIIIPVHNRIDYTDGCLKALANTPPRGLSIQIVVVDDASTDETSSVLGKWMAIDTHITVIRNEQALGFIDSCNRGADVATGEMLVFLNNDTVPQSGWLLPLLRTFHDYPEAGAVGGKLIYPDGRLQEAGGVVFSDGTTENAGRDAMEPDAPQYNYVREVDYCSGALLATWRSLFMESGSFDTRFRPAYYEDVDYCFSVRRQGYRVYYQPESVVIHHEWGSAGPDPYRRVKALQSASLPKFIEKWGDVLATHPSSVN